MAMAIRQLPSGSSAPYTMTYASVIFVWLGPLTTIYTPASSCYETTTYGSVGGLFIYDYQIDTTLHCWPSIYGTTQITSLIEIPGGVGNGYYSPGICPSGWTGGTTGTNFYGTRSGTAVLCCPPKYTLTVPSFQAALCYIGLPGQGTITNVWSPTGSQMGQVSFGPSDTVSDVTLSADTHVACSPISVSWEPTDTVIINLLASLSGSPTTTSASSPVSKPTSSSPTSSSPGGSHSPTGTASTLSSGAKAGIAIAIVVSVIAIILGIFFFFRRRGRFPRQGVRAEGRPDAHEMSTKHNTHEMLTKHNVPEMEVDNSTARRGLANELDVESDFGPLELDGLMALAKGKEGFSSRLAPGVVTGESSSGEMLNERMAKKKGMSEDEEARLQLLKDRIEKIRVEKERLRRIQELEDMEEMTARQIAEGGRMQELEDMEETVKREILDTELRRDAGS